jgi:class II lanthipeptide synthase
VTDDRGQALLRAAVESVALDEQGGFRWLGRAGPHLMPGARTWLDDDGVRTHLVNQLTQCLYGNFYVRGEPMPWRDQPIAESRAARTAFVNELSRANVATGTWYSGRLERVDGDYLVVRYGGLQVYARPEECDLPSGALPQPGQTIRMRLGRESLRSSPGYYLARGDRDLDTSRTLRWYWHLVPRIAVDFVARATQALGAHGVPYHLKVLADPALYVRCDAGVIYTSRTDAGRVAEQLAPVWLALAANLRSNTPAFTRAIAPGVGIADDPGAGDSFGLDRCRLVAEGLARASEAGAVTIEERLAIVKERFREAGLDPRRPYLAPGLEDLELPGFDNAPPARKRPDGPSGRRRNGQQALMRAPSVVDPLAAAVRIGDQICREAVWYRQRCQWVGAETTFGSGGAPRVVYRTLAPTLYGGTSGIALFLGELSRATGDRSVAQTALGAIREALSSLTSLTRGPASPVVGQASPKPGAGLYSGSLGVALVAVRLGRMLHDDEVTTRGLRLAARLCRQPTMREGYDLLYGSAGRILGLLALDEAGVEGAGEAALRLGMDLVAAAEPTVGISWPTPDIPSRHNLTGLSHGAAGIAMALVELGRRSGDDRFDTAAGQAVEYETNWFEPTVGNWPDFRLRPRWRAPRDEAAPSRFSVYWCHGAPGIALQRLRAARLPGGSHLLDDVRRAAATTADSMTAWLRGGDESFSLCHGLLGNAEILREAAAAIGDKRLPLLAQEAASEGLRRHGEVGDWPCGTLVGDTPSLLLGRAGIGYFYLRLHDRTVPSVLAFDPAEWRSNPLKLADRPLHAAPAAVP